MSTVEYTKLITNVLLDMKLEQNCRLPVSKVGVIWCDQPTMQISPHFITTTHLSGLQKRLDLPPRISIDPGGMIFVVLTRVRHDDGTSTIPTATFSIRGSRDGRILAIRVRYIHFVEDEFGVFLDRARYQAPYIPTVYPVVEYPNIFAVY